MVLAVACTKLEAYDCARGDCPPDSAGDPPAIVPDARVVDALADAAPPACGSTAALGPRFEPSEWYDSIAGAGSTAAISDGAGRVRVEVADGYAGLLTNDSYTFGGSSLTVELESTIDPMDATGYVASVDVDVPSGAVGFSVRDGNLVTYVADVTGASAPYQADAHRFLRLANADGQFVFETSPDGAAWRRFDAVSAPDTVGAGRVGLFTYTYASLTSTARVPSLNPGQPGSCL